MRQLQPRLWRLVFERLNAKFKWLVTATPLISFPPLEDRARRSQPLVTSQSTQTTVHGDWEISRVAGWSSRRELLRMRVPKRQRPPREEAELAPQRDILILNNVLEFKYMARDYPDLADLMPRGGPEADYVTMSARSCQTPTSTTRKYVEYLIDYPVWIAYNGAASNSTDGVYNEDTLYLRHSVMATKIPATPGPQTPAAVSSED
ncbi:hypothetical protein CPLU01_03017 [Colletotrichum plurivorum]|uniref:Uncharacterized protein n=1 Tax=Colletotrichum plurivorum TaxID=2175906 RepID=A0A8H6NLN9_9PEZI|nr:hypothetical protein CPLU01_03017 [Colletotrichum plurivorum]